MAQFAARFQLSAQTRVLDVGGSIFNWELVPVRPKLTIMNLAFSHPARAGAHWVAGSGTALPFADDSFDIVFSNSVIEHVGDENAIAAFAAEVRRVGRGYYVQTPNRNFPVEPHYLSLGLHYLPRSWQKKLLRFCSLWGWLTKPSRAEVEAHVDGIHLLNYAEMRDLFPDAELHHERLLGCSKSLIAQRLPTAKDSQ